MQDSIVVSRTVPLLVRRREVAEAVCKLSPSVSSSDEPSAYKDRIPDCYNDMCNQYNVDKITIC
jgi:hypothetical protein